MLSFIVPIYKPNLVTLEKCLKSLAVQSLKEFEVLCILDGPNPEAKRLIAKVLKNKDYQTFELEHGGVQKARNFGATKARFDLWVFWDGDCQIEPDTAQGWVDIFTKQTEVGFIYSSYKFDDNKSAIHAEPFDPWLLKVRNYISTCFPLRKKFYPGWNESLKSLQDWSFWLSIVEKGAVGKYLEGYAFSTSLPTDASISGQGCTADVWLERVDAVKRLHNLPERETCVTSLQYKHEGVRLAKLLEADYQNHVTAKPHRYKNIISVGFSLHPIYVEGHCRNFNGPDTKKFIFWTPDNITEIYQQMNLSAIQKYAILLNISCTKQFVEDKAASDMMTKAGFNVEILPMPLGNTSASSPLPEKPKFAIDISGDYSELLSVVEKSLPDVTFEMLSGKHDIDSYTGLVHFYSDRSLSQSVKRSLMCGRHVVSNIQSPFTGFVDDQEIADKLIPNLVEKIRGVAKLPANLAAREFYAKELSPSRLLGAM